MQTRLSDSVAGLVPFYARSEGDASGGMHLVRHYSFDTGVGGGDATDRRASTEGAWGGEFWRWERGGWVEEGGGKGVGGVRLVG